MASSSNPTFALYQLALAGNKEAFLAALNNYPADKLNLDENQDLDPRIHRSLLRAVILNINNLGIECYHQLIKKVGDDNFLEALHSSTMLAGHAFDLVCSHLPFDEIIQIINKFNTRLMLNDTSPFSGYPLSQRVDKNNQLTPEQKAEIKQRIHVLSQISGVGWSDAEEKSALSLKICWQYMPPIPGPFHLPRVPTAGDQKQLKERAQWKKDNQWFISIIQRVALKPGLGDSKVLNAVAKLALFENDYKKACSYWGRSMRDYSDPPLDYACQDFLLHSPKYFEPYLLKSQCEYFGFKIGLALDSSGEHLANYADKERNVFSKQTEKESQEIKEEEVKGEEKKEEKDKEITLDSLDEKRSPPPAKSAPKKIDPEIVEKQVEILQAMIGDCINHMPSAKSRGLFQPSFSPEERTQILERLAQIQELAFKQPEDYLDKIKVLASYLKNLKALQRRSDDFKLCRSLLNHIELAAKDIKALQAQVSLEPAKPKPP